jgi:hypothetical protein
VIAKSLVIKFGQPRLMGNFHLMCMPPFSARQTGVDHLSSSRNVTKPKIYRLSTKFMVRVLRNDGEKLDEKGAVRDQSKLWQMPPLF